MDVSNGQFKALADEIDRLRQAYREKDAVRMVLDAAKALENDHKNMVDEARKGAGIVTDKEIVLSELDTGALKHLAGKVRMDLVPPEMIQGLANVLTYGSKKYEDRNWEKGIPLMTSYGAAMRHLVDGWLSGIDNDEESGLLHLEHALCNIAMMVTQIKRGRTDLDNRPTKRGAE